MAFLHFSEKVPSYGYLLEKLNINPRFLILINVSEIFYFSQEEYAQIMTHYY
jgi:hypothetical protein